MLPPRSLVRLAPLATLSLAVACGGSQDNASASGSAVTLNPATACAISTPGPVTLAVRDFITTAEPRPLRFLNAVATDSALPEAAAALVQDKGPTFYWLSDEKSQQQIRSKLATGGDWPTMLVLLREHTDHGDGTHTVRIGGRYVERPNDGEVSPEKRYTVSCQTDSTAVWAITSGASSDGT